MQGSAMKKEDIVREILKECGRAAIAFSGGVDSTYLLDIAYETLGEDAFALSARSPLFPAWEMEEAESFCRERGIRQIPVTPDLLGKPVFAENPPDRCYHCKKMLFGEMRAIAEGESAVLMDGSNTDDSSDFRPGLRALSELMVRSPLKEAGLTKEEIRERSEARGLSTARKPSYACLATRFAYGEPVVREKLASIDRAERAIRELGYEQVRVRIRGDEASIEVEPALVSRLLEEAELVNICDRLSGDGFARVVIDPKGYRTGSMNERLTKQERAEALTGCLPQEEVNGIEHRSGNEEAVL